MNPRKLSIFAAVVELGLMLSAAGCEPASDEAAPGQEASAGDSPAVGAPAPDTSAYAEADEGWRPLAVPEPGRADTYPLIVRNPHGVPLVVFADGGAGEVLLDTIAGRDSSRVRLLIAADSVTLRAVGPGGEAGPAETISLDPGSEVGWEARF